MSTEYRMDRQDSSRTTRRRTESGRNRSQQKRRRRKKSPGFLPAALLSLVAFLFLVCVGASAFLLSKYMKLKEGNRAIAFEDKKVQTNQLSAQTENVLKGYKNFLILGVDSREKGQLKGDVNADVNIIVSISHDTHEIKLLSVYRDTFLKAKKDGEYAKINAAFLTGGPLQSLNALNQNLDLKLKDYVAVDWSAVATLVNDIGGIELNITDTELKYINGYITETVQSTKIPSVHLKHAGLQKLDGIQTVAYCRIRYGGGNDYKRTERQRTVIYKLLEKLKKENLLRLNSLVDKVLPLVSTSMDAGEILGLVAHIKDYSISTTTGWPKYFTNLIMPKSEDSVIPMTLEKNVRELHKILFRNENYVPSRQVQEISKTIERLAKEDGKEPNYE